MRPRLYLAGPEVFLPDPVEAGRRKKALCRAYGFEGVYPLDEVPVMPPAVPPQELGLAIYRANRDALRRCDLLIANLTPFRGPSADPGTVFELGLMAGLGRPVFGYSDAPGTLEERTRAAIPEAVFDQARDAWIDADGLTIESFQLADNLMLVGALADWGSPLVQVGPGPDAGWAANQRSAEQGATGQGIDAGFTACLVAARAYFGR